MPSVEPEVWRKDLQASCPILHDVMLQERDEFMAYRILLALELRLKRGMPCEALLVLCGPAHVEERCMFSRCLWLENIKKLPKERIRS